MILHRDLGYTWVNFVRLASVRLAPLDVNIDMALVDALLEVSTRVMDLMEVSGCVDTQGNRRTEACDPVLEGILRFPLLLFLSPPVLQTSQYHATMLTLRYETQWAASPLCVRVFALRASTTADLQSLPPSRPDRAHTLGRASPTTWNGFFEFRLYQHTPNSRGRDSIGFPGHPPPPRGEEIDAEAG